MAIVGIDLGLSQARIGWLDGPEDSGEPRVAAASDGSSALPAAVRLTDPGPSLVGAAALERADKGYLIPSVRRALAAPVGADDSSVRAYGHTPETVVGLVLEELVRRARSAGVGRIEQAVLGVPADFDLAATAALRRAAEGTELRTPRFALEPVAVALHYRLGEGAHNVVVCDLGGARREITALMISGMAARIVCADFAELGPPGGGEDGWDGAGPRGAERTAQAVREVIEQARIAGMPRVDAVLLAGGGFRSPTAAAGLARLLGIEVRGQEPDLAVVKGLARYAHLRLLRVENLYGKNPRDGLRPLPYLDADPSPPTRTRPAQPGPAFEAADPSPRSDGSAGPTRSEQSDGRRADDSAAGRSGFARESSAEPIAGEPAFEEPVLGGNGFAWAGFDEPAFDQSVFNESVFDDFGQDAPGPSEPSERPPAEPPAASASGRPAVLVRRPVERLTAVRREGKAVLTFAWPAGAEVAVVRWRTGRGPDSTARVTDEARVSRRTYEHEGAVTVEVGLGAVDFTVEALVPGDGETEEPPSTLGLTRPRPAVRYLPEVSGHGRRRIARITLTADDSCALPDLLVVRSVGRYLPSGPHEGTVVYRVQARDLYGSEPFIVEFPLPELPRQSWLVCFPAEPSAVGIDLFPQSVHRLKVR